MRELLWAFAPLIGWILAHMSFAIPARRLSETSRLLAFHHPRPAHAFHVLMLPKNALASLADLDASDTLSCPLTSNE